jgi:alpha,alpha-trehalase
MTGLTITNKWSRREILVSLAGSVAIPPVLSATGSAAATEVTQAALPNESEWALLDRTIRREWQVDMASATESEVRKDSTRQLLFLPFPYVSPTAAGSIYAFMFGWDTDFVSRALIAHGKMEQARNHLLNHFFMIDRYGYVLNANAAGLATRSQTPLTADTAWRYYRATGDREFLLQAYPRLKRSFVEYWTAPHHQTPSGLATNRDLGDPHLDPRLAAEAETGLDWTPIYNGDVRRCTPLITNCALVRYAAMLAKIAREIGESDQSGFFRRAADTRAALIRRHCWSEGAGFFLEYDFVSGAQLPYLSECALWALWAGVASRTQARRLVDNLQRIEQPFGLSCTDQAYPVLAEAADYGPVCRFSPNGKTASQSAAAIGGESPLQWMYPAGWAPSHMIAVEGLDAYGFRIEAARVASKFLGLMVRQHQRTGHLWEKYNVVDGSLTLPNARCGNIWMHGWTAAAVVLLGRRLFRNQSLQVL